MVGFRKDLWRSPKAGSTTAGCTELNPDGFQISPEKKTPQPL